jgi:hypothetical protein
MTQAMFQQAYPYFQQAQGMPQGMPQGMGFPHPRRQKTTQYGFQPVYNQSSLIPQNRQAPYQTREGEPQEDNREKVHEEVELEIVLQEEPVEQALQKNPEFLKKVSEEALRTAPNIFQIEMETYPLCPWKRVDPKNPFTAQQYRQWFNYNLTPKTWTRYAENQKKVQERLRELTINK